MLKYSKCMDKVKSAVLLSLALLLPPGFLFGADPLPLTLQLQVMGLDQAGPPAPIGSRILFSYQPAGRPAERVGLVGARFEHESFRILHAYARNPHGVFVLLLDREAIDPGRQELRYRIVEDGLWMADPFNPEIVTDELGTEFSVVPLGSPRAARTENPALGGGGAVTLRLQEAPGRRITVCGSFNSWDPFLYALTEEQPGRYRIDLRLPPGTYYYHFWVDGEKRVDPHNPLGAYDPEGKPVSRLVVPKEPRSIAARE